MLLPAVVVFRGPPQGVKATCAVAVVVIVVVVLLVVFVAVFSLWSLLPLHPLGGDLSDKIKKTKQQNRSFPEDRFLALFKERVGCSFSSSIAPSSKWPY